MDAVGSAGGVVMAENVALQLYGGDASGDFGNYRNAPDAMSHVPTDVGRPGRGRGGLRTRRRVARLRVGGGGGEREANVKERGHRRNELLK